jgi:hypothetical protein
MDITKEGELMNSIMYQRCIKLHKNFIKVKVGPTGSGKSLSDLREIELWYKQILKRPFPIENIVFSTEALMERIEHYSQKSNRGENIRGEIIMFEEAGTSMGNLDFQTSISKAVNYVLQAFRSMNLILFINLPYFSMLNKSTRMLCHMLCQTEGIDKARKVCKVKPQYLYWSQLTGKLYTPFPQAVVNGYYEAITFVEYQLPEKELWDKYEEKKKRFLQGLISGSHATISMQDKKRLTPFQMQVWGCFKEGMTVINEIAKVLGCKPQKVTENLGFMRNKGYLVEELYQNA